MEDYLILDADELDSVANIIEQYSRRQIEIIDEYLSNICSLGTSWQDDQTFAPLYNEIVNLKRIVESKMEAADDCATRLRIKAEFIRQRPKIAVNGATSSYTSSSTNLASSSGGTQNTPVSPLTILSSERISRDRLNTEMCINDGIGRRNDYVRVSSNSRRLSELDNLGTFLSPSNGKPIYCKSVAWRSANSTEEINSMNMCGAEFYYADGTFCGSYVGESWQDIYDNNVSDTEKYRR